MAVTMKQTNRLGVKALGWITVALVAVLLARSGLWLVGVVALAAIGLYRSRKKGASWATASLDSPSGLVAVSMLILMALAPQVLSAWLLAAAFVVWLVWYEEFKSSKTVNASAVVAAISQLLALTAIFMAAVFWHWPTEVVLILVWLVGWLVADRFLRLHNERARPVMATAWALVATETSWIFLVWAVSYVVTLPARLGGLTIVLPQAAVVLSTLSYCLGGIYVSHANGRLNRARLVEYLMIGLGLIVMVIAGTRWNGVI